MTGHPSKNEDFHQKSLHNGSPDFNDIPKMSQIGVSELLQVKPRVQEVIVYK